ncbi:MAG: tRNA (adenosine(37)-N6)-threonylcarbamoyltransferase complex ATPase subunit type 1 TsaE [Chitinophagales bacterium]
MKKIEVTHIADLENAANSLLEFAEGEKVFVFYGEMGTGKTTFIQRICKQLKSNDAVSSPTYSLVNEYSLADGNSLFHLDLYRLKDLEEAYNMGIEEYLYGGDYCLIEWPQIIEPLLEGYVKVDISLQKKENRLITMTKVQF